MNFETLRTSLHELTSSTPPLRRAFFNDVVGRYPVSESTPPGCASLIALARCSLSNNLDNLPRVLTDLAANLAIPEKEFGAVLAYASEVVARAEQAHVLARPQAIDKTIDRILQLSTRVYGGMLVMPLSELVPLLQNLVVGTTPLLSDFAGSALARYARTDANTWTEIRVRRYLNLSRGFLKVAARPWSGKESIEEFMASPKALAPERGIAKLYGLFDGDEPGVKQLEAYLGKLKSGARDWQMSVFYCDVLEEFFGGPEVPNPRVEMLRQKAMELVSKGSGDVVARLVQDNPAKYGGTFGRLLARVTIETHQRILGTDFNAPSPARAVKVSRTQQQDEKDAVAAEMDQLYRKWLKKQAGKAGPPASAP